MGHCLYDRMELVVQSIFDEGRCLHANAGNLNRVQECTMCFNQVLVKVGHVIFPYAPDITRQSLVGKEAVDEDEIPEETWFGGFR